MMVDWWAEDRMYHVVELFSTMERGTEMEIVFDCFSTRDSAQ